MQLINIIEYNFIFDFFQLSYKARFSTDLLSPVESSSFVLLITHFVIFHISNCSKLNVLIYKVYFRVDGLQVLYQFYNFQFSLRISLLVVCQGKMKIGRRELILHVGFSIIVSSEERILAFGYQKMVDLGLHMMLTEP